MDLKSNAIVNTMTEMKGKEKHFISLKNINHLLNNHKFRYISDI